MTRQVIILTTSWNDGHPLDYEVADILEQYGIRATFYIPRQSRHYTISESHIRELSERFEIGAQTLDNVELTHLSTEKARQEIADSKSWLEQVTGQECRVFSYPEGKFASTHAAMVQDAGFIGARTSEYFSIDFPRFRHGIFEMPTTVQVYPQESARYLRNTIKRGSFRRLWEYIQFGWGMNWDDLARMLWQECMTQGGVFHLWGHSWEIEQENQWDRLEEIFRFIDQYFDVERKMTNAEVCDVAAARRAGRSPVW
jgi:peptidoglycan-N-acetylglucosamine deacetylase